MSYLYWPHFTQEEVNAVSRVLLSSKVNYWTGEECRLFEKEFATFADCKYAVALANGTVALDTALKAIGLKEADEVITTPRTFIATASSIVNTGAIPVFADVDLDSQNITAESIKEVLTKKTKAIIVVHLAGRPAEMDAIMDLSREHNLFVIEDCAQAHGARYKNKSVGSIGHIGTWSFCQDKIMTTGGEGGMVTTNDEELWSKMWSYKDHGKSYEAVYKRQHPPGFRWLHESFGTNGRMMEMQAAIGRIQLGYVKDWVRIRQRNAQIIEEALENFRVVRTVKIPNYMEHAYYRFCIFIEPQFLKRGWTRDKIIEKINNKGVPCMQWICSEVYLEKAFEKKNLRPKKRLRNEKILGETGIAFLVHPTLTEEKMREDVKTIVNVLKGL